MTDHIAREHAFTIAQHVVTGVVPAEDEHTSARDRLEAIFPGAADGLLTLVAAAVSAGYDAGQAAQAPADDRITMLASALRHVHVKEMFGDCTEDGDPYPCRTIRALDIVAGPAETAADEPTGN